jgi:hypothetical protein
MTANILYSLKQIYRFAGLKTKLYYLIFHQLNAYYKRELTMEAYKLIRFNSDGTRTESIMLLPPKQQRGKPGQIIKAANVRMDDPVLIEVKK